MKIIVTFTIRFKCYKYSVICSKISIQRIHFYGDHKYAINISAVKYQLYYPEVNRFYSLRGCNFMLHTNHFIWLPISKDIFALKMVILFNNWFGLITVETNNWLKKYSSFINIHCLNGSLFRYLLLFNRITLFSMILWKYIRL